MTALKIRKIGNSLGIILPKEVMARLNVGEGDTLTVTETAEGFHLTTVDEVFEAGLKAYERTRKRYRNTLRELAK
ncbi:MAG: AbrB/MazE/SpoVT family DNA-binding domain-containing protein [Rhodospirillales bacterium]|nr:AbrB/MazE/SpoVT family DNA-binding domain-containing protein [Rhodospirillales bacterium]